MKNLKNNKLVPKQKTMPCAGCTKVYKSCRPTDFEHGGNGTCPQYESLVLYKPTELIQNRLLTNGELAKWLAKGNGELKIGQSIQTSYTYYSLEENSPIQDDKLIRPWGKRCWSVPYYLFCKEGLEK